MNKYETYKPSGIEWIGEIPSHWKEIRMRFIGHLYGGLSGKSANDFNQMENENNKHFIPFTNIAGNLKINPDEMQTVAVEDKEKQNRVEKGDLFFLMSSEDYDDVGKSSVLSAELNKDTYLNSFCKGFRITDNEVVPEYLNYHLYSDQLRHNLLVEANGFTRINLKIGKVQDLLVAIPPKQEQTTIARYLDRKTAEIDQLIADKKRLLSLYEEEKTAIINQAVTKGINPDVPMKDSSIEWLDEIPEHWEVKRIDRIAKIVRGNTGFKKDELLDIGEYVALQYGKTYKVNEINASFNYYVNSEFYKSNQIVQSGDVILISTSETLEDLGHSCFYTREDIGLLGGEQILLNPISSLVSGKYLYYSSKVFCIQLRKYARGIKVFRFNIDNLKEMYTAIPSIDEQNQIVQQIDNEITRIDTKKAKTEKLIDLLKEYRQALISEVVTGKVKVID